MVAFRTPPQDSTGVAHILEHTTLCGSQQFPVRDPFFMMLRRSLNSFMNAMTSSDWTAYPFATRCEPDYWNLLDVYLDATFFPLLTAEDFAQEGHRLEFSDPDNTHSNLVRKGVVFNEMKGAMSTPAAILWHGLNEYLCAGTPYQYNSGGNPSDIPNLSHAQLLDFHRAFYRPGNAVFMSAGEVPPQEVQARIQDRVLTQVNATHPTQPPALSPSIPRWSAKKQATGHYPTDTDNADRHHSVLAWVLPESRHPLSRLRISLMSSLLLGTPASPLRQALESCGYGRGLSPITGLDDSQRDSIFVCGLKDVSAAELPAIEPLIMDSLAKICREGIDPDQLQGTLQNLEFGCREITGDGMPFSLELLMTALPALLYGDAPEPDLDPSEYLEQLHQEAQQPDFARNLIETNLLNNPHRLHYELRADPQLAANEQQAHQQQLQKLRDQLSPEDKQQLQNTQQQVAEHQKKTPDASLLPRVTTADIQRDISLPEHTQAGNFNLYEAETNGISYLEIALPLTDLSPEEAALMPLYCSCLTGLGTGTQDYGQTQTRRAQFLGGISAQFHIDHAQAQEPLAWLSLTTKALDKHTEPMLDLSLETLNSVRFDEYRRIAEIKDQMLARRENGIASNGHALATQAATASFSNQALIRHHSSGLGGLQMLANLCTEGGTLHQPEQLAAQLQRLHLKHQKAGMRVALVAAPNHLHTLTHQAQSTGLETALDAWGKVHFKLPGLPLHSGWIWQLAVNYCALAMPAPGVQHADAAALSVLAAVIRHHWLHPRIREQGSAYGAGAACNLNGGSFSFFSYRDPRLSETLQDFKAVARVIDSLITPESLEEAILSQISSIDKIGSPAGEALGAFHRSLTGQTNAQIQALRQQILATQTEDLKRAARHWLEPLTQTGNDALCSTAVLTSAEHQDQLQQLGFENTLLKL